jgi:hypothetical protein
LEKTEAFGDSEKEKIITKELAAAAAFSFAQLWVIFLPRQLCQLRRPDQNSLGERNCQSGMIN